MVDQGLSLHEQAGNVSAEASSAAWSYSEAVALPHLQASLSSNFQCNGDIHMMITLILIVITWVTLNVVMTILVVITSILMIIALIILNVVMTMVMMIALILIIITLILLMLTILMMMTFLGCDYFPCELRSEGNCNQYLDAVDSHN